MDWQKACNDAVQQRDRRGWLPSASPLRDRNDGDTPICAVDIISQHLEFVGESPAMVLSLQMVTKTESEAHEVAQRLERLLEEGALSKCVNLHCMPEGGSTSGRIEALGRGRPRVFQPLAESNLQQPFLEPPAKLQLLTVPSFVRMLRVSAEP
jgi:hypothetical protein